MYLNMYPIIEDKQQLISHLVANFSITRNEAIAIMSTHFNYLVANNKIKVS